MSRPEFIVRQRVCGDGIGATEMQQQEWNPEYNQRATYLLLSTSEEGTQGHRGQPICKKVHGPNQEGDHLYISAAESPPVSKFYQYKLNRQTEDNHCSEFPFQPKGYNLLRRSQEGKIFYLYEQQSASNWN
ncbi:hypothetical protein V6N12_071481 [Hibiscus sabdariffa]|uniref:Uncharacterized protein n=1 Tax=Hibiscus sabdariffa TaxID=183260 RepID=A0ABR2FK85_9ROSI